MKKLLAEIKNCRVCQEFFQHPCHPVMSAHPLAKICIIGQAPGQRVQASGIPWADKSGANLMDWMGLTPEEFYNPRLIAILPMGFCYPGKGKSGDLPPRKECAPLWHDQVLKHMPELELILLVGKYAQEHYLEHREKNLTETVRVYQNYLPQYFPLPHPSPRNNIWKKKNLWFEKDVIPALRDSILRLTSLEKK